MCKIQLELVFKMWSENDLALNDHFLEGFTNELRDKLVRQGIPENLEEMMGQLEELRNGENMAGGVKIFFLPLTHSLTGPPWIPVLGPHADRRQ